MTLNLFYREPDPDRWFLYDRYPRRIIRRIFRGKTRPGGQRMVFLNLMKGLQKSGLQFRINDYRHIKKHPEELACIIGKPVALFERNWENPVLFGASIFSHPIDCQDLFERYPVKKILVPGPWMQTMFEPFYGDKVQAWPVGIDTDYWSPTGVKPEVDLLIYSKILWNHRENEQHLVKPILDLLEHKGLRYEMIRYGHYFPEDLIIKAGRARAVIFLCEHETQGIAYQQLLAMNRPILAWEKGGYWEDPAYYPQTVKFNRGVTSVPYWDDRCGMKFRDFTDFTAQLPHFLDRLPEFEPRQYILENLTLEHCARAYVDIARSVQHELNPV